MVLGHLTTNLLIIAMSASVLYGFDFSKCGEYYLSASREFDGVRAIHIGDGQYIAYSQKMIKNPQIIKHNEILGLYLFKDEEIKHKFTINDMCDKTNVAAIKDNKIVTGKIIKQQTSIRNQAMFSKDIDENSIIINICYQVCGLSTQQNKFITKKYIDLFINSNNQLFRYIGIDAIDDKDGVIVSSINPLIIKNVNEGDRIESVNGVKITSADQFVDLIFSLDENNVLNINGNSISIQPMQLHTPIDKKISFLEVFGIVLNNQLKIVNNPINSQFKNGDQILGINKVTTNNINQINSAIISTSSYYSNLRILVLRDGFEFFLTLDKPRSIDRIIK